MLDPGIHITKVLTSELETLIVNLKQLISISNEGIFKCSAQCLTSQLKLSQKGRGGYRGGAAGPSHPPDELRRWRNPKISE